MAFDDLLNAERSCMDAKAADQSVHGVQRGVTEETDPQLEIAGHAAGSVDIATGLLPERAAPEGGFLLDVTVRAGEKAVAGPAHEAEDAVGHAVFVEDGGAASNPLDLGKIAEDEMKADGSYVQRDEKGFKVKTQRG